MFIEMEKKRKIEGAKNIKGKDRSQNLGVASPQYTREQQRLPRRRLEKDCHLLEG